MTQNEKVKIALGAIDKHWDFEELKYSDNLYGREHLAEDIWAFVEECVEIGAVAFRAKYEPV